KQASSLPCYMLLSASDRNQAAFRQSDRDPPATGSAMNLLKSLTALAIVSTALQWGTATAGDYAPPSADGQGTSVDRAIESDMAKARIVGVGAAIIVNKKVVWTKGYGFADKERGLPFTPDTVMNIGSISKTVTGAALMRAVQDGKLSLDRDINSYLPFKVVNPYFPNQPITLRQLATHTSSITDRGSVYAKAYHFGRDSPEPLGHFLEAYFAPTGEDYSKENFIDAKPGTHREYSNIAAGLAGLIVETAVGEKLSTYTRRKFFAPLKMDNTGWLLSDIELAKHSNLYIAQGLSVPIQLYGLTTYPDGGLRTSVADLSRFFIALLNEGNYEGTRILDQKTVAEMLRLQYDASNQPDNVKLSGDGAVNSGIFWATKADLTRIGHSGADPGLVTMMVSDLSKDVAVVVFFNTAVPQEDGEVYGAVFERLWKQAEALKKADGQPVEH
ncbi:MAG: ampC, partial [Proteobacteria bacterium]|nr:ampC [Pseudomonadota bacterium]